MSSKKGKSSSADLSKGGSRHDPKIDPKAEETKAKKVTHKSKQELSEESDSDSDSDFAVKVVRAPQHSAILQRASLIEQQRMDGRFDDPNDLSLESSSSGEEDEDAEMAEPILDDFLSMIPKLAEHDPEIYEKDKTYFPPEIEVEEKEKGPQKVTYKDMARRNILDRVARGDDAGSDMDDDEALEEHRKKAEGLSYAQEQELAKREMLAAVWGDTDSGDEEADEAGLIKIKSASEQHKQMIEELVDTEPREPKKPSTSILNYWTRKDLNADELFLRDYVLNKRWMGVGDTGSMKRTDLELVDDDEDTKELEKQDDFETAYNFRYEDPHGHQLVSHARSQPESVRVETNKRADARARKRERKRLEKQAAEESKIEEKKKKKAEILARIGELTEASGLADGAKRLVKDDAEEDWDPDAHDNAMETAFDEDYYAQGEKHRPDISTAGDIEDVEEWLKKVKANAKKSGSSAGADAAEIEKALEDYYNLDFDEVIGEDRVRFRYTEVPKQDYGLTNEELLNMSDSELDAVIPMKKLSAYREDGGKMKKHRIAFKRREWAARRMEEFGLSKKKKSHKSSPGDAPEAASSESTKQKKRRRESFDGSEGADSKPATKKQKTKE